MEKCANSISLWRRLSLIRQTADKREKGSLAPFHHRKSGAIETPLLGVGRPFAIENFSDWKNESLWSGEKLASLASPENLDSFSDDFRILWKRCHKPLRLPRDAPSASVLLRARPLRRLHHGVSDGLPEGHPPPHPLPLPLSLFHAVIAPARLKTLFIRILSPCLPRPLEFLPSEAAIAPAPGAFY